MQLNQALMLICAALIQAVTCGAQEQSPRQILEAGQAGSLSYQEILNLTRAGINAQLKKGHTEAVAVLDAAAKLILKDKNGNGVNRLLDDLSRSPLQQTVHLPGFLQIAGGKYGKREWIERSMGMWRGLLMRYFIEAGRVAAREKPKLSKKERGAWQQLYLLKKMDAITKKGCIWPIFDRTVSVIGSNDVSNKWIKESRETSALAKELSFLPGFRAQFPCTERELRDHYLDHLHSESVSERTRLAYGMVFLEKMDDSLREIGLEFFVPVVVDLQLKYGLKELDPRRRTQLVSIFCLSGQGAEWEERGRRLLKAISSVTPQRPRYELALVLAKLNAKLGNDKEARAYFSSRGVKMIPYSHYNALKYGWDDWCAANIGEIVRSGRNLNQAHGWALTDQHIATAEKVLSRIKQEDLRTFAEAFYACHQKGVQMGPGKINGVGYRWDRLNAVTKKFLGKYKTYPPAVADAIYRLLIRRPELELRLTPATLHFCPRFTKECHNRGARDWYEALSRTTWLWCALMRERRYDDAQKLSKRFYVDLTRENVQPVLELMRTFRDAVALSVRTHGIGKSDPKRWGEAILKFYDRPKMLNRLKALSYNKCSIVDRNLGELLIGLTLTSGQAEPYLRSLKTQRGKHVGLPWGLRPSVITQMYSKSIILPKSPDDAPVKEYLQGYLQLWAFPSFRRAVFSKDLALDTLLAPAPLAEKKERWTLECAAILMASKCSDLGKPVVESILRTTEDAAIRSMGEHLLRHGRLPPPTEFIRVGAGPVTCLDVSRKGEVIAGDRDSVGIWDSKKTSIWKSKQESTGAVAIQPDGGSIAYAGKHGTLSVVSGLGRNAKTLKGHTKKVTALSFSPDGKHLASASADGAIRLWDTTNYTTTLTLTASRGFRSVTFSNDSKLLLAGCSNKTVYVWRVADGETVHKLTGHGFSARALQCDGKTVLSGSDDMSIRVWDLKTGKCLHTLLGHTSLVTGVDYLENNRIISSSIDGTIRVWDLKTGKQVSSRDIGGNGINAMRLCPLGKRILLACRDGRIVIFERAKLDER